MTFKSQQVHIKVLCPADEEPMGLGALRMASAAEGPTLAEQWRSTLGRAMRPDALPEGVAAHMLANRSGTLLARMRVHDAVGGHQMVQHGFLPCLT